jgi:hypothetical protein
VSARPRGVQVGGAAVLDASSKAVVELAVVGATVAEVTAASDLAGRGAEHHQMVGINSELITSSAGARRASTAARWTAPTSAAQAGAELARRRAARSRWHDDTFTIR